MEERLQQTKNAVFKQSAVLGQSLANVSTNVGANISHLSSNMPDTVKQGGARLSVFGGTIRDTGMSAGSAAAAKA